MGEVFADVIGLGASVMMPVIFTVLGVSVGIKLSKALNPTWADGRWGILPVAGGGDGP